MMSLYVSLGDILVDFKVLSSRLHRNSWVTLIFLVCFENILLYYG
jgi:hypothetical protein